MSKYFLLLIAVIGFGFALGKSFNPMVALVKAGKWFAGIEGNPAAWLLVLGLFCLLAIVGTKMVCGWVCPYGALQELLFKLPFLGALKKKCKAPFWLFKRMEKLAREIALFVVKEQGTQDFLKKISDPFWFQAFGCVLGFDWHSSGLTTTTCGALKEGLKEASKELGLFADVEERLTTKEKFTAHFETSL